MSHKKIKEHVIYLLVIIMCTILLYMFKLTHYSFSIDTECLINNSKDLLRSWYGIGRYGLCLFKTFFHTIPINIEMTNFFATIFLAISSYLWIIYFELVLKNKLKPISKMIGMLLIVSSPIVMEQMGFVLQSLEIMVGFCLSAIGSIIYIKYLENKKISFLTTSIILILITFTFYQAFMFLFVSSVIIYLICDNKEDKIDSRIIISNIMHSILFFIVVFILYFSLDKYILITLNIEKTSYLSNQFLWGTTSTGIVLQNILKNLIKLYSGYFNCYHPFFTVFSFVLIYDYALKEKIDYWKLFLSISLFIVPSILLLVTGSNAVGRAQFSIIITLSFYAVYILENINKKIISNLTIIIVIFQSIITIYLQVSAQNVYDLDKKLAIEITNTLKYKNLEDKKIAIIGSYNPNDMLKGEVLGHSFFEWDNFDGKTSNGRINGFFNSIGFDNQFVFDEQLPYYYEVVKDKPTYFDNKTVYIENDAVIIKLDY